MPLALHVGEHISRCAAQSCLLRKFLLVEIIGLFLRITEVNLQIIS